MLTSGFQLWTNQLHATFVETGYYTYLIEGLDNTVLITVGALLIGMVIGLILAIAKYLAEDVPVLKPIVWLCDLYINVIRGVPVVVLLLTFILSENSSAAFARKGNTNIRKTISTVNNFFIQLTFL